MKSEELKNIKQSEEENTSKNNKNKMEKDIKNNTTIDQEYIDNDYDDYSEFLENENLSDTKSIIQNIDDLEKSDQEESSSSKNSKNKNKKKEKQNVNLNNVILKYDEITDIIEHLNYIESFAKQKKYSNLQQDIIDLKSLLEKEEISTENIFEYLNKFYVKSLGKYFSLINILHNTFSLTLGMDLLSELISKNIKINKEILNNLSFFKIKYKVLFQDTNDNCIEFKTIKIILLNNFNLYPNNEIANKLYDNNPVVYKMFKNETKVCLYYLHMFLLTYGILKKYYYYSKDDDIKNDEIIDIELSKKIDLSLEKSIKVFLKINDKKKKDIFPLTIEKKTKNSQPKPKKENKKKIKKENQDQDIITDVTDVNNLEDIDDELFSKDNLNVSIN